MDPSSEGSWNGSPTPVTTPDATGEPPPGRHHAPLLCCRDADRACRASTSFWRAGSGPDERRGNRVPPGHDRRRERRLRAVDPRGHQQGPGPMGLLGLPGGGHPGPVGHGVVPMVPRRRMGVPHQQVGHQHPRPPAAPQPALVHDPAHHLSDHVQPGRAPPLLALPVAGHPVSPGHRRVVAPHHAPHRRRTVDGHRRGGHLRAVRTRLRRHHLGLPDRLHPGRGVRPGSDDPGRSRGPTRSTGLDGPGPGLPGPPLLRSGPSP